MRILRPLLTTALVAGAFTALGPAAYAGTSAYSCADLPASLGSLAVPLTMTLPDDPGTLPAQMPVTANSMLTEMSFGLPSALVLLLGNITGLSTAPMDLGLGSGTLPLQAATLHDFSAVDNTMLASAFNDPFTLPGPGSYPVTMPSSFHLVGAFSGTPFNATCVTDSAAQIGTLVVGKNSSTTTAKAVRKRIVKNHAAKIRAQVSRQFGAPASGRVVVKKGKKKIGHGTLSGGAVTVRTAKFKKPGRYLLTVRYRGDSISTSSKDKVVVKVLKRRS